MTFQWVLTQDRERELVDEYQDGWTVHELTIIYRVSERTVYRILARYDVPRQVKKRRTPRKQSRTRRVSPIEAPLRVLKPCGTNAAYQRHRRAGEYPCTPCLAAHALNVKEAKEKL